MLQEQLPLPPMASLYQVRLVVSDLKAAAFAIPAPNGLTPVLVRMALEVERLCNDVEAQHYAKR